VNEMRTTGQDLQQQKLEEQQRIYGLEAENKSLSELVKKLKSEKNTTNEENVSNGQNDELLRAKEEECTKLQATITRLENEVKQTAETLKQQSKTIEARETQLEKHSSNYSQLQQAYSSLQNQFQTYQQKMEEEANKNNQSMSGSDVNTSDMQQLLQKKKPKKLRK